MKNNIRMKNILLLDGDGDGRGVLAWQHEIKHFLCLPL